MANVLFWYSAKDLGLADTAAISTVPDRSPNRLAVTQATPANQPTFAAAGVNGKPAMAFLAPPQSLTSSLPWAGNNVSFYFVGSFFDTATVRPFCGFGASNPGAGGNNLAGKLYAVKVVSAVLGNGTGTYSAGVPLKSAVTYDGASYAFYRNGAADGSGTAANSFVGGGSLVIGDDGGSHPFKGYIAEILGCNRVLSPAEIALLDAYAAREWGV